MKEKMKLGELFAGYGGLGMAVEAVFGAELAWVSEFDEGPSKVLAHRFPHAPNHGDITKIDWSSVEPVDILSGGFPCQDVSLAGKRAGLGEGTRTGLWSKFAEAIETLKPTYVVAENVRGLLSARADSGLEQCPACLGELPKGKHALRALGAVLGDLADLGYDAKWVSIKASDPAVGAPHQRFRVILLATRRGSDVPDSSRIGDWWGHDASGQGESGGADNASGLSGSCGVCSGALPISEVVPYSSSTGGGESSCRSDGGAEGQDGAGLADECSEHDQPGQRRESELGIRDCRTCGDRVDLHDAEGFCAGRCGGTCTDEIWGQAPADSLHQRGDGSGSESREAGIPESENGSELAPDTGEVPADSEHDGRDRAEGGRGDRAPATTGRGGIQEEHLGEPAGGHSPDSGSGSVQAEINWGAYEPAIRRWEFNLGRPAPRPTLPTGRNGAERLSAPFVEWMMGLPEGWVTDPEIGLTRSQQLKALGNGVVPQQAYVALRWLLSYEELI